MIRVSAVIIRKVQSLLLASLLILAFSVHCYADDYASQAKNLSRAVEYVTWAGEGELLFCVVGRNPFGETLDKILAGKKLKARPIKLRYEGGTSGCDLIYSTSNAKGIITKAKNVLTVSDAEGFADEGGIIQLTNNGDIHSINEKAAKAAGLKISADLLETAKKKVIR
ncbi:YfiR family protein [Beggiatoa leptomitoformis]|uniref:DUF4154 domain-containing protein n=1 Tax=Beggiatoa leptomitoformis TaxID=288004 RepID=A0A2N9YFN5_9GAMM|nr:YfiR family protein [Beggiatoa leptomitoformis]AUI69318.1 DUF4154 domain-containing protein [Beggiatoa leptomitoformis]QGX03728.1 DUF4154 domain-containing protein [Beggiatoa leptomitoformis]